MNRIQLILIFSIGVVQWIIGNGLFPLLPVYALELGADVTFTGNAISASFVMVAIAAMLTGWLSDRLRRQRALLIGSGVLSSLSLAAIGLARTPWQFAISLAINWFFFGVGIAVLTILAGLLAPESERGRVFGVLALTGGFGLLLGGLLLGPIADRWGYPTLFIGLAVFGLSWPVLGLLIRDSDVPAARPIEEAQPKAAIDGKVWLYLFAFTAAWIGFFVGRLGMSIAMESLDFSSTAISSTAAVGGAVTLPLPFLLGWLSDRSGRLIIIAAAFVLGALGLGYIAFASELWQFWVAIVLLSMIGVVFGVGSAHIADIVPVEALGVGLSMFETTTWIAGVVSGSGVGYAIDRMGLRPSVLAGELIFLLALGLLAASARRLRPRFA